MAPEYKIEITQYAFRQLEGIRNYITYELMAPRAAFNLMAKIRKEITELQWFPRRYALVDEPKWLKQGVRRFSVKNFLIYYWIEEELKLVHVIAVIYGRRDQLKQLEFVECD